MKKAIKLIKIIGIFLISLFLITFIWYLIERASGSNSANSFAEFLMYLLGYGEVKSKFVLSKTVFTVIGLLSVTLLSSAFTVSLFDLRRKLKIFPDIIITKSEANSFRYTIAMASNRKDIYNIRLRLMCDTEDEVYYEDFFVPYLSKSSKIKLIIQDVLPGTVVYDYLRAAVAKNDDSACLLLVASYIDMGNGQEYTICNRYRYEEEKFIFVRSESENILCNYTDLSDNLIKKIEQTSDEEMKACAESFLRNDSFAADLSQITTICSEDIDVKKEGRKFTADLHMNGRKEYKPDDFCMVCIPKPFGGDWSIYRRLSGSLEFDYSVSENTSILVEIKGEHKIKLPYTDHLELKPTNGTEHFSFDFSGYEQNQLKNIEEICFTAFYKNTCNNTHSGSFMISDLNVKIK